ncbi:polygalacturonase [Euphorbia lathyris]|uniref:polygalacturonase n=1 Tax=Euphorbia lathyris TaxID=212925 RepID=UPI003313EA44
MMDHFTPFFLFMIVLIVFSIFLPSSYDCFQLDTSTINDYIEESSTYETSNQPYASYPSYFSPIQDGPNSNDFFKLTSNFLNFKIYDQVGVTSTSVKTVNVRDFGAKGDGSDDTQAFEMAWKEACSSSQGAVIVVSGDKTYRIKQIRFKGPCKSSIMIQIYGSIEASDAREDYEKDTRHWIVFDRVQNLLVTGGGIIDGNGNIWWKNSCKINKDLPCKHAPTAVTFYKCKNLVVEKVKIQNAQQMHISFEGNNNVQVSNLVVNSPEDSPNTDGIHITQTQNIHISNTVIETGDDCISIENGSQNVLATDITCGPGHGISIGSLGSAHTKDYVSGVVIDGAKISGTSNGVRIKTWQGGSGIATNIKFQNIIMDNVTNPIIIDQNYCDQDTPCKQQKSAVQVKNVVYKNIKGTSASDVAIKFDCSKNYPCEGILMQDVVLQRQGDQTTKASCVNVHLAEKGAVSPHCP